MNFRKLITYLTMGTAAVMPFATAQNPTILQGSYISNVFGNSNFVLNPNAQTSTANVTVSSATVTRSTTTPLVATSEFNITTSTATGYADWALRTFDQGMKGQNCEARFTYRGFSVGTTTAQILQGTNVVAQLALTASTDPRIASINFPCGDLSAVTKFRLQQASASLTGTNEIGGIYVGLATNMANVAQAELVGSYTVNGGANCAWSRTGAGSEVIGNFSADSDCSTGVVTGAADTSAGKIPGVKFNNLMPGKYMFVASYSVVKSGANTTSAVYTRLTDGTSHSNILVAYSPATDYYMPSTTILHTEYTTTSSPTVQVQGVTENTSNIVTVQNNASLYKFTIYAYRFPTSSELVVTPERQNTFAAARFTNGGSTLFGGVAAPTGYGIMSDAGFASNVTRYGKASAPLASGCFAGVPCSANDLGFSVSNMPTGSYSVKIFGLLNSIYGSTDTECSFQILEAVTGTSVGAQAHQTTVVGAGTRDFNASYAGIFNNTAVATRNFIIRANKTAGSTSGQCQANAASSVGREIYMELIPLDQPSNSALYVQGPVQGSNTNTAIPTNSIGGKVIETSLSRTTTALGTWQVASGNFGTPPAGSYLMIVTSNGQQAAGLTGTGSIVNESGSSVTPVVCQTNSVNNSAIDTTYANVCYYTTDGSKTLYAWAQATGANAVVVTKLTLVRLN